MKYAENHQAWRYHKDYAPCIFTGEEIEIAEEAGWVDSPAKVETVEEDIQDVPENTDSNEEVVADADDEEDEEETLEIEVPEDLSELTVKQLKKLCKKRNLTGYSKLKEAELVALLEGK